jgi:sterol 3beta-glucosyltransferase
LLLRRSRRCCAIIHHGGAGTTAIGLEAGKPTLVCPAFGDHFTMAAALANLHVGPTPVPLRQLNAKALAAAMLELRDNERYRLEAGRLGMALRGEDGLGRAAHSLVRSARRAH